MARDRGSVGADGDGGLARGPIRMGRALQRKGLEFIAYMYSMYGSYGTRSQSSTALIHTRK